MRCSSAMASGITERSEPLGFVIMPTRYCAAVTGSRGEMLEVAVVGGLPRDFDDAGLIVKVEGVLLEDAVRRIFELVDAGKAGALENQFRVDREKERLVPRAADVLEVRLDDRRRARVGNEVGVEVVRAGDDIVAVGGRDPMRRTGEEDVPFRLVRERQWPLPVVLEVRVELAAEDEPVVGELRLPRGAGGPEVRALRERVRGGGVAKCAGRDLVEQDAHLGIHAHADEASGIGCDGPRALADYGSGARQAEGQENDAESSTNRKGACKHSCFLPPMLICVGTARWLDASIPD